MVKLFLLLPLVTSADLSKNQDLTPKWPLTSLDLDPDPPITLGIGGVEGYKWCNCGQDRSRGSWVIVLTSKWPLVTWADLSCKN